MLYPKHIARCHHIKSNGIQCGSPALKNDRLCYFHSRWNNEIVRLSGGDGVEMFSLPVLEDANSIQILLMQVIRALLREQIDPKRASLLLYALQTASSNLKRTAFEPELPTKVVIDERTVADRPVGATAWSHEKNRDYDDLEAVEKKTALEADEDYDPEENKSFAQILLERLGLPEPLDEEASASSRAHSS